MGNDSNRQNKNKMRSYKVVLLVLAVIAYAGVFL